MLDGICPKCGSHDVYCDVNIPGKDNSHRIDTIMVKAAFLLPSFAVLDNYVCVQCGYLESYVPFPESLQTIADNWTRVRAKPRMVKQEPQA
jgi:predicted nucleic-acid-binding Zn-ribbon protein